MKKTVIASALGLATGGLLSAQGLYNIMPFGDEPTDSLPLNWTAGASLGWDSNASPVFSESPGVDTDDVIYLSAFVQANFVNKSPQTTIDVWARAGILYYLDNIDQNGGSALPSTRVETDLFPVIRGGVNFVRRVNECLRLRSRSNIAYEQEPDYNYGIATDRRAGSYLRWSSDNSVGYRWTERLGTNTGYRISGVTFDEADRNDFVRHLFYNQFRYRTTPSTVWTAAYRYQLQTNDASSDSYSHYFLVGAEHELSATSVVVLRAGGQVQEIDGGSTNWSPYVEATLRAALSEAASVRVFARYGLEDRNRLVATQDHGAPPALGRYEERRVLRVGAQGSYVISEQLTAFGGANVVFTEYDSKIAGPLAPGSLSETIVNVNVGASYEVIKNIFVTGSYNFTNSASDADIRDYDRSRVQLGVQASF